MIGEHIHWYLKDECNLDCAYCFKQEGPQYQDGSRVIVLAHHIADSDVAKVTIGGGEPTLERNLPEIVTILKEGGKYVSLHTNGVLLDDYSIAELGVDDIALPFDSTKRATQRLLRGRGFLSTFDRIPHLASLIQEEGIKLGYHTVHTAVNSQDIPDIYDFIKRYGFDYWRIYELNDDLALSSAFSTVNNDADFERRFERIERLRGLGTPEKGYSDCLLAEFLLMEQKMNEHNDPRVQFVGRRDTKEPYAFLENSGDVRYYTWLSGRQRRVIGNVFTDGFKAIRERLQEVHEKDWDYDANAEDAFWWATVGDMPLWARLWDGNFLPEELESVSPEYIDDVYALSELHTDRVESVGV